jgi:hypothetical protein
MKPRQQSNHYVAYNIGIRSEIALPALAPAPAGDDFQVRLCATSRPVESRSIDWRGLAEARFLYPGLARFVVRGGRELVVTPDPRGDRTILHLYIQGMMLASALHQRGLFVLRASVVAIEGRAVAFMGPVGIGKSTFAAAFRALGHKIVADDNAALEFVGASPRVLPAFPSLPVPFHCIYVLDRQAPGPPSRISPIETVKELIRHSVPTRWGVSGDGRHLKMCTRLANMVPLFRVRTFRELHEIRPMARVIEAHALSGSARTSTSTA